MIEECKIDDNEYGDKSHRQEKVKIQNNLLKVDVYFENLRVKSVQQSPTYKVCYHGSTALIKSTRSLKISFLGYVIMSMSGVETQSDPCTATMF